MGLSLLKNKAGELFHSLVGFITGLPLAALRATPLAKLVSSQKAAERAAAERAAAERAAAHKWELSNRELAIVASLE